MQHQRRDLRTGHHLASHTSFKAELQCSHPREPSQLNLWERTIAIGSTAIPPKAARTGTGRPPSTEPDPVNLSKGLEPL